MNIIETNLEFNSNISKRDLSRVKRQILHNSGVSVLQSIEVIHNYHKNTRGWAGIGYHFYVRKDGTIYEGRKVEYVGAHATNNNSDSIGICFEGNFNEETMPDVQKQAGKWLVSYLKEKYNANIVQAHRDVNNTSCPGTNFPFDEIANGTKTNEIHTIIDNTSSAKEFEKYDAKIGEFQKLLNQLYNAGLNTDNWWGEKTANATKKYVALKNGSKGNLVRWYQVRLKELGYDLGTTGDNGIDGDFRTKCEKATKEFQEKYGLDVDGVAGIQVIRKLVELM